MIIDVIGPVFITSLVSIVISDGTIGMLKVTLELIRDFPTRENPHRPSEDN